MRRTDGCGAPGAGTKVPPCPPRTKPGTTKVLATAGGFESAARPGFGVRHRSAALPALAELGRYSLDVRYTDAAGKTVNCADSGELRYLPHPVVTLNRTGHLPKAKAAGSVRTYQGGATTAANGSFSTKVTARGDGAWQIRCVDATAPYYVAIGREDYVEVL